MSRPANNNIVVASLWGIPIPLRNAPRNNPNAQSIWATSAFRNANRPRPLVTSTAKTQRPIIAQSIVTQSAGLSTLGVSARFRGSSSLNYFEPFFIVVFQICARPSGFHTLKTP